MNDKIAKYIEKLNDQQKEVALHGAGPALCLAVPGSGKTTTITARLGCLVDYWNIMPERICGITFTNKAAKVMRDKAVKLLGDRANNIRLATFHALGVKILRLWSNMIGRNQDFSVLDDDDAEGLFRKAMRKAGFNNVSDKSPEFIDAWNCVKLAKTNYWNIRDVKDNLFKVKYIDLVDLYENELTASNSFDFNDLLGKQLVLFDKYPECSFAIENGVDVLQVDEVQDINRVQFELIKRYVGKKQNLLAVGDLDQAIYSWRGADRKFAESFPETFQNTKLFKIETNYRSTPEILASAKNLISFNHRKYPINLMTPNEKGVDPQIGFFPSKDDEAKWIANSIKDIMEKYKRNASDFAILYRANYLSRVLEQELRKLSIHYKVVGGISFYDREEIKTAISYLELLCNDKNSTALERIVAHPKRGLGEKNLLAVEDYMRSNDKGAIQSLNECDLKSNAKHRADELYSIYTHAKSMNGLFIKCEHVLSASGFLEYLKQRDIAEERNYEGKSRFDNVIEFLRFVKDYEMTSSPDLSSLLQQISLLTSFDESSDNGYVTLSTMHGAKGLEWPAVFVCGLTDGVCPHKKSITPEAIEEERRLLFVSMTRAERRLYLTSPVGRNDNAELPSRFLKETGLLKRKEEVFQG